MDVGRGLLSTSRVRARVQFESRVKFESGSVSSVFFPFCFVFVLIKGCDYDSCCRNDVPTDVRSIDHEPRYYCQRDRENSLLVAN